MNRVWFAIVVYWLNRITSYRPQGEGNVCIGVYLSIIGLMATGSLLVFVMAWSVRILLECSLVFRNVFYVFSYESTMVISQISKKILNQEISQILLIWHNMMSLRAKYQNFLTLCCFQVCGYHTEAYGNVIVYDHQFFQRISIHHHNTWGD